MEVGSWDSILIACILRILDCTAEFLIPIAKVYKFQFRFLGNFSSDMVYPSWCGGMSKLTMAW